MASRSASPSRPSIPCNLPCESCQANGEAKRHATRGVAVLRGDSIKGTDFFSKIPKTWCCDELIEYISSVAGGYSILSSPLEGDETNCAHWKKVWIEEQLLLKPNEIFIKREKGELALYQGRTNILIDDRPHNIEDWQNSGGKAIRFQANEDPIEVVKDAIKEVF